MVETLDSGYSRAEIDKIFGINNSNIVLVNTVTLAATEVIHTKPETGVRLLQVKKYLFGQMKSEEYWPLLTNERVYFKEIGNDIIENDLWKCIQFDIFTYIYFT